MNLSADDALDLFYTRKVLLDEDGNERRITGEIPRHFADALTGMVRQANPRLSIEIGMAYGASTLAILRGLGPQARHLSIDPFASAHYGRAGRKLVEQTVNAAQHELIEEPNYLALPRLLKEGLQVDFAYIDGNHAFEHVVLDTFYIDKLLSIGGIIGFNDCGFRSIHKYLKFFRKNRHYEELDPGLPSDFRGANPLITAYRRLEGRSNQDRYFRKVDAREPEHNEFHQF